MSPKELDKLTIIEILQIAKFALDGNKFVIHVYQHYTKVHICILQNTLTHLVSFECYNLPHALKFLNSLKVKNLEIVDG